MGKAIAIFNQKGGVGKTTTNINLAACLAIRGKKVLILDIDPQGNTTSGIGVRKRNLKDTIYNILVDKDYDPRKAIIKTSVNNLDLIPASVDLAGAEVELVSVDGRENALKEGLDKIKGGYDYIFIDTPPMTVVTDAAVIMKKDMGVVVVVRENVTTFDLLDITIDNIKKTETKLLGVIMLGSEEKKRKYGYYSTGKYGYRYNYNYHYGDKQNKEK